MNSTITSFVFGFGGWMGILGGIFLIRTVPQTSPMVTLLVSPWLGGIALYLLVFATHAWMNIAIQIIQAMLHREVLVAFLKTWIGIFIVLIARLIINMERAPRTMAELAATESSEMTEEELSSLESSFNSMKDEDEGNLADNESGDHSTYSSMKSGVSGNESEDEGNESEDEGNESEDEGNESDDEGNESEDEGNESEDEGNESEDEGNESEDEGNESEDEGNESEDEGNESEDEGNESEDEGETSTDDSQNVLNRAACNSEESYENIQTPQLSAIRPTMSPIPHISDI